MTKESYVNKKIRKAYSSILDRLMEFRQYSYDSEVRESSTKQVDESIDEILEGCISRYQASGVPLEYKNEHNAIFKQFLEEYEPIYQEFAPTAEKIDQKNENAGRFKKLIIFFETFPKMYPYTRKVRVLKNKTLQKLLECSK